MKKFIVYTVGYGGIVDPSIFVQALSQEKIEMVVDVRANPHSGYCKQFGKMYLPKILKNEGVEYVWMGEKLGGYAGNSPRAKRFKTGIQLLLPVIKKHTTVIMCAEKNPDNCHRGYDIAPALLDLGIEVIHLTIVKGK